MVFYYYYYVANEVDVTLCIVGNIARAHPQVQPEPVSKRAVGQQRQRAVQVGAKSPEHLHVQETTSNVTRYN